MGIDLMLEVDKGNADLDTIVIKKMQLDVGSEPYLTTARALCLLTVPIFYYKSVANWQRITAIGKSESLP